MMKVNRFLLLASFAWLLNPGSSLQADCRETAILENANTVLNKLAARHLNRFQLAWMRKAQGVAIFPGLLKAAVFAGGRHGRGVLLTREADGSWGPPVFLTLSAASFGIQLGVEGTDLVLVFLTRSSLDRMKKGKVTLSVSDVLVLGPIGVEKDIGTDVFLKTALISHSRGKGLFAGVCAEGALLHIDAAATAGYGQYEQGCLQNGGPTDPEASPSLQLQMKLAELSAPTSPAVVPSSCAPSFSPQP